MFPADRNPKLERVEYALRSRGVKDQERNPLRAGTHSRGYLPHVKREGAPYFVTFRLDDSLPKEAVLKLLSERAAALRLNHNGDTRDLERKYFAKMERLLDSGSGQCWLRHPAVARLVVAALKHFDGTRYFLSSWVVMPNHVHVVATPAPNQTLSGILHTLKRHTAREANKILQRTGTTFWQRESYDHWIRDPDEKVRCCRYVINNPVKARLCSRPEEWPWSSAAL